MKKFPIIMLVLAILLSTFSAALCKGALEDGDLYVTYYGKTKTEAKKIAPRFEDKDDGYYLVDISRSGNDFVALMLRFGSNNKVDQVALLITNGALEFLDYEDSLTGAAALGITLLGFTSKDISDGGQNSSGDFVVKMKSGVTVKTMVLDAGGYAVTASKTK